MWRRTAVFVLVIAVGLALAAARLAPLARSTSGMPYASERGESANRPANLRAGALATVSRLNETFARGWARQSLVPAARADDLTIARRMSLALAGTIPSLEEIRLLEAVPHEHRLAWHLERILADRRHHDYLAERLARAYVGTKDGPFIIYRRRRFVSWLADQLASNRSYDAIVRDLVADDGLYTDQPATNFITATIERDDGTQADENELASRVSRALLGVRLDCAQCHDHPFAPWEQADFQGLAAFFANTRQTFSGVRDVGDETMVLDPQSGERVEATAAVPFYEELLPKDGAPRQRLARWLTARGNRAFARAMVNRMWVLMLGRALVEPVDNIPFEFDVDDDALTTGAGEAAEALEILTDDFVKHGYDVRRLIEIIASTDVFALDSRSDATAREQAATADHEAAWAVFPLSRLRPEQVATAIQQATALETLDSQTNLLLRLGLYDSYNDFIRRYGDAGEDELSPQGGTIPQRLLMMNGRLVRQRASGGMLTHASAKLAALAPRDKTLVEIAYLTALTRRPTPEELAHFTARLDTDRPSMRKQRVEDLYWALLNSTEFSWNH